MIRIITSIIFIVFFLNGCFSKEQKEVIKENRIELGDIKINYYSDKSVTSLEVPPDLTHPSYENSFRLTEYVQNIDPNIANLTNEELVNEQTQRILQNPLNISVEKSGSRRWLVVEKSSDVMWDLSRQWLKELGFVIKKSNKKIGVMETDYLENQKPEIPAKSMGWVRAALQSTIDNVNYTMPTVDKYKIRIEPISDQKSEVHLSVSSMAEVVVSSNNEKDRRTLWQKTERDVALEAEMLYQLMIYLGSDVVNAREKINSADEKDKIKVSLENGINGYAKLLFESGLLETWDNLSWAFSELDIDIEDKDLKEKTFYLSVARTSDKGVFSRIFGDDAIANAYQIRLKQVNQNLTEVYFNDISEVNEQETKDFSYDLLGNVRKLF